MKQVAELQLAAAQLPPADRAELALYLLGSLEVEAPDVDDEEVAKRREELNSGAVRGLSRSEFKQACGR